MTNNIDKIETETPEEAQAFLLKQNAILIDTTPNQVFNMTSTSKKPHVIRTESGGNEFAEFGEYITAKTCEEILKMVNLGATREDLITTLQATINSSRKAAGVSHV